MVVLRFADSFVQIKHRPVKGVASVEERKNAVQLAGPLFPIVAKAPVVGEKRVIKVTRVVAHFIA